MGVLMGGGEGPSEPGKQDMQPAGVVHGRENGTRQPRSAGGEGGPSTELPAEGSGLGDLRAGRGSVQLGRSRSGEAGGGEGGERGGRVPGCCAFLGFALTWGILEGSDLTEGLHCVGTVEEAVCGGRR